METPAPEEQPQRQELQERQVTTEPVVTQPPGTATIQPLPASTGETENLQNRLQQIQAQQDLFARAAVELQKKKIVPTDKTEAQVDLEQKRQVPGE
jgi:hypothetical protein